MKLSFPSSIKGMVTVIVTLAIMPALALIAYSGYSAAISDIEAVNRGALQSARNIARQQMLLVENTRTLLLTLSNLAEVRDRDLSDCSVLLQNIVLQTPVYADIRLCDVNGDTLAASSSSFTELSGVLRGQVAAAAASDQAFTVQELTQDNPQGRSLINCLFPLRQDGKTTGVLLASVIVHVPGSELAKLAANQVEYLHIVDRQGHAFFVYPPSSTKHKDACSINCLWQSVDTSPARYGLASSVEGSSIAYEKLFLGQNERPDLTVFLSISTSAIFERMRGRLIRDLAILLGVASLAVFITHKLCNAGLRTPMSKLLAAANRIKEGDLQTRLPRSFAAKELNLLAESLNSMTQSLESRDRELIDARDAATAASTAKSEFLANMSHEIRTPMNAILGMTYLARNSELTERQRNYIDNIQEEAGKLLTVINDILDFSKIEAGKVQIETVSFTLPKILAGVLQKVGEEARRKSVGFSFFLPPNLPESLGGDPLHLSQVLSAILNHAVKDSHQGQVSFRCAPVAGGKEEVTLTFEVSYTGGDTENEEIVRSLSSEESDAADNAGLESGQTLSLTIARNLARLMGGSLEFSASSGTGKTVTIRLPFAATGVSSATKPSCGARKEEQGDGLTQECATTALATERAAAGRIADTDGGSADPFRPTLENVQQGEASDDSAPPRLDAVRILLAEDNPVNQQIAEEILTDAGALVHTASNGQEALNRLLAMPEDAPYHIVLMDLQMPELDGLAATRLLRRSERFATLPIIAMTAHGADEEWPQCREAGMNDFITKPIDVPTFLRTIRAWMRPDAEA